MTLPCQLPLHRPDLHRYCSIQSEKDSTAKGSQLAHVLSRHIFSPATSVCWHSGYWPALTRQQHFWAQFREVPLQIAGSSMGQGTTAAQRFRVFTDVSLLVSRYGAAQHESGLKERQARVHHRQEASGDEAVRRRGEPAGGWYNRGPGDRPHERAGRGILRLVSIACDPRRRSTSRHQISSPGRGRFPVRPP